jgi:Holliday junction resolvasome RuvABC endonuclease subunit
LIVVSPRRFDSLGARFLRFEKGIRELLQTHRPALVVFEEHRAHAGVQAAQVLGACSAILMKCCDEVGVTYMAVPVITLKKHATGTHRASKELMVAVARKKYPTMHVPDDNVADALHIMAWGLDQL